MDSLYEDIFGRELVGDAERVKALNPPSHAFMPCRKCKNWNKHCYECWVRALPGVRQGGRETQQAMQPASEQVVCAEFAAEVETGGHVDQNFFEPDTLDFNDETAMDADVLSEETTGDISTADPVWFDVPPPSHLVQVLTSVGNHTSNPPLLPYLSRSGRSRTVYGSPYQQGTAHAVGFWSNRHHTSFEDILADWLRWKWNAVRREGILEAFLGSGRLRDLSSLDVD